LLDDIDFDAEIENMQGKPAASHQQQMSIQSTANDLLAQILT